MKALESRIEFTFPDAYHVVKFDDTAFYRREFAAMPSGKGVDFLADSDTCLLFVEVKNCIGNEAKERWRTAVNGQKPDPDALDDESFDVEVSKKVAMTIACLTGAATFGARCARAEELIGFAQAFHTSSVSTTLKKKIIALFVLEGKFGSYTRNDRTIRRELQHSLQKKLRWLNCTAVVTDLAGVPAEWLKGDRRV